MQPAAAEVEGDIGRGHDGVGAAADAVARFQHDGGEAGIFQRVRGAEAGGARTDNGDIDFGGEGHAGANGEWRIVNGTSLIWPVYSLFATPLFVRLGYRLLRFFRTLAVVGVEEFLAQPDRLRCHLDQFVVLDIGQRLFQRHLDRRGQAHRFVLRSGADVGELLALEDVDLEIVVAGVLTDDHALVNLAAGLDHHRAAILQFEHRIGHGLALIVGDQDAVAAALDIALVRRIVVEQTVHDGGAAGVRQQFALIADQAAGRRVEHQPLPVTAGGTHLNQLGLAFAHLLHDDAGMLLVDVDHDFLDRLLPLAGGFVFSQHDARTRHRQLETFAAHGLDQDA